MRLADLLRDPLYRYEARRYWTGKRYAGAAVLLLGWWGVLLWFLVEGLGEASRGRPDDMVALVVWSSIAGRMPLSYLAAAGAALAIVPERVSGQLEQFVLTPVDPWRFCLARWAGRLRGLFPFWVGAGAALFLVALWQAMAVRPPGVGDVLLVLLVVAAQVDLAAMLMVDAAVGMRFTSTSRSTPEALIKTFLTSFLLVPFSMMIGAFAGGATAALIAQRAFGLHYGAGSLFAAVLGGVLVRLALGAASVFVSLRDARRAIDRTFYQPERA